MGFQAKIFSFVHYLTLQLQLAKNAVCPEPPFRSAKRKRKGISKGRSGKSLPLPFDIPLRGAQGERLCLLGFCLITSHVWAQGPE